MSIPAWADEQLSHDLPELRARGEGQEIEFKQEFPQQVSDLAKEIAAFATSNTGTLMIGVKDNGDLVGLEACGGAEGVQERDRLLRRLEGICIGSLKPAVTPRIAWAIESGQVVLVVTVPKGSEPLYYSQGKPYLRHLTTSRPAEPHEVVELVKRHLASRIEPEEAEESEESAFYSELGSVLNRVLLWAVTPIRERSVNPWLEEWRADYSLAASDLMRMAARDAAIRLGIAERLREVADALTEVSTFRLTLGCGAALEEVATSAKRLVLALKVDTIDKLPLGAVSLEQVRGLVREATRVTVNLSERAQQMANEGRIEEVQSELGSIGSQLVQLSFYDLRALGDETGSKLRETGMRMRLLEVARIYMDGGSSLGRVVNEVAECANKLMELARGLDGLNDAIQQADPADGPPGRR